MQVIINFVITVKPSNTFQYLPIPNLQWQLQIADKKQTTRMIYYEIFLKKPSWSSQLWPALLISGQKNQVPIGAPNQAPSEL